MATSTAPARAHRSALSLVLRSAKPRRNQNEIFGTDSCPQREETASTNRKPLAPSTSIKNKKRVKMTIKSK